MLRSPTFIQYIATALAGMVMGVALLVIFGWITKNNTLIQVLPIFAPMQINTAVCFVLAAFASLSLRYAEPWLTIGCALIMGTISLLTLVQYMFNISLGIDMLLTDHVVNTQISSPGRMAFNTAFSILLLSFVLLFADSAKKTSTLVVLQLMLYIVFLIGMTALAGYAFELPYAYGWGIYTKMAIHTASLFILISFSISFMLASKHYYSVRMDKLLMPLVVFSGTAFMFILLWNAQLSNETSAIRLTVRDMQKQISQQVYTVLDAQVDALARIGKRWEMRGGTPKDEWIEDVKSYQDDFKAYRAIEWADADYVIRWIQPVFSNEAALNFDLKTLPSRKVILDKAKRTGDIQVTEPLDLIQGRQGMVIVIPLKTDTMFDGFILAVIDIPTFFNTLLSPGFYGLFELEVSYLDQVFYTTGAGLGADVAMMSEYEYANTLHMLGYDWKIVLRPTKKLIESFQTMTPAVTLMTGLFLSFCIALAWFFMGEHKNLVKQSRQILDSAQAGLLKASLLGVCEEANSQLCLLFGSTREHILERGWLSYVDASSQDTVMKDWHDAVAHHKDYAADFKILRSDGTPVWVQCYASIQVNEEGEPIAYIITFYNIDSLKLTEAKLKNLSYKDELTDLPNRRYLIEVLKTTLAESLRYHRPFTVMYLDIDYFKEINDTFGHAGGDAVLKELGSRVKQLIRGTDFIARMGGDEFCLIMREASSPEALKVMVDRIRNILLKPMSIGGTECIIHVSMGVVVYANESITYEELLSRADTALYKAKTAGRNNVKYYGKTEES